MEAVPIFFTPSQFLVKSRHDWLTFYFKICQGCHIWLYKTSNLWLVSIQFWRKFQLKLCKNQIGIEYDVSTAWTFAKQGFIADSHCCWTACLFNSVSVTCRSWRYRILKPQSFCSRVPTTLDNGPSLGDQPDYYDKNIVWASWQQTPATIPDAVSHLVVQEIVVVHMVVWQVWVNSCNFFAILLVVSWQSVCIRELPE